MLCWLCIVQSLWAYTPGIRAGAECGAAALTPLGATPQTPFSKIYRFFDRLKHPVLSGCLLLFMLYFTRLRVCEISLFDLRSASAPYQCAVAVIQSELFINRRDVIHIDYIAPVTSEKA